MTREQLLSKTVDDVQKAYSGKAGKCCCGCAGKYYYNPMHREAASKSRGYEVSPSECNAKQVTRILRLVQEAPVHLNLEDDFASVQIDSRWYVVYFAN